MKSAKWYAAMRSRRGVRCSDETRQKIAAKARGNKRACGPRSEAHCRSLSEALKGNKLSESTKQKLRDFMTGKRMPLATRLKISNTLKSFPPSYSQKARLAGIGKFSNTKPERAVRALLEARGVEFVAQFVHPDDPYHIWDFAIPSRKLLIEVDGCYWHGCKGCGYPGVRNASAQDARKNGWAEKLGWKLIRIPEHSL